MLQNIKRKAAEQRLSEPPQKSSKRTELPFIKIAKWALPVAACLAIVVVGIRFIPNITDSPESGVELVNPFESVDSAKEFQNRLGISVCEPSDSKNVSYTILDGKIAQIDFDYGDNSYTLRASKQSGDFSGINGTLIKSDKIDAETDAVLETIRGMEFNYLKLTWTDGVTTYILMNNSEISEEDIREIYEIIK